MVPVLDRQCVLIRFTVKHINQSEDISSHVSRFECKRNVKNEISLRLQILEAADPVAACSSLQTNFHVLALTNFLTSYFFRQIRILR